MATSARWMSSVCSAAPSGTRAPSSCRFGPGSTSATATSSSDSASTLPTQTTEDLLRHIEIGPDRTWEQDPLLAFRLLVDIGLRAQSPAINDPATCRHTIEAVSGLLRYIADRHLTIGDITDPNGGARLVLRPVTWEDYVAAAVDELIEAGRGSASVAARLVEVLDDLTTAVPADRRGEIRQRLQRLD